MTAPRPGPVRWWRGRYPWLRYPWLRPVAVLAAVAATAALAPVAPAGPAAPPVPGGPPDPGFAALSVRVPADLPAGAPAAVDVLGGAPRATVRLLAAGPLGTATWSSTADVDGVARFRLPAPFLNWAGRLVLVARAGPAVGSAGSTVHPGPVTGPVTTVVGARSIVADGSDVAMGVAIPMDAHGNAPPDGTPVRFLRVRPDGSLTGTTVRTRGLLAWARFRSGTRAGTGAVHTQVGEATGPESSLLEVPAPPVPFRLLPDDGAPPGGAALPADGRTLVGVTTDVLRDEHGNVQRDGTLVTVTGSSPLGVWTLSAVTVAGRARFFVRAPASPGVLRLTGACRGTAAAGPLALTFTADGVTAPASARRAGADLVVEVGPVRSATGAQVADGAVVRVTVTGRAGGSRSAQRALVDGRASVALRVEDLDGPLDVQVSLLGTRTGLTVP